MLRKGMKFREKKRLSWPLSIIRPLDHWTEGMAVGRYGGWTRSWTTYRQISIKFHTWLRNFNENLHIFIYVWVFLLTCPLSIHAWIKPIKRYIFLIVLFPWLTVDLQVAFYNECYNKLTFKGAYTLSVEVFDLKVSCHIINQLK